MPRKPDEEEFKELWQEVTLAYQSINAFNTPDESETQNVESYCKMNYRRQLRASHLKIIDKMKKYNQVLKNISLQTLEYWRIVSKGSMGKYHNIWVGSFYSMRALCTNKIPLRMRNQVAWIILTNLLLVWNWLTTKGQFMVRRSRDSPFTDYTLFMFLCIVNSYFCVNDVGNPGIWSSGWRKPVYMENMMTDDTLWCNILSCDNVKYIWSKFNSIG